MLNERFGLPWPADMYMEGGDQYRGWFHSSLLVGTGLKGGSPYRACALNGWVLDGEGKAMHKSLGNAIEPEDSHQATTAPKSCACGRPRSISTRTCASPRPS